MKTECDAPKRKRVKENEKRKRKLDYFGYIIKNQQYELMQIIIEGENAQEY